MTKYADIKNQNTDWIEEFYDKYFKENLPTKEIQKCIHFKNSKMPPFLYQYSKSKHAEDLLKDDLMFLRTFDKLNDPFDGHFLGNGEEVRKITVSELKNGDVQINVEKFIIEADMDYKKYYKVACFSEYNDSAPMWAFYGDNHKGICVEYKFQDNPLFEFFCMPIQYVESTDNNSITEQLIANKNPSNRVMDELFVKKSESWSYEKEWRIIVNTMKPFERFEFKENGKYLKFMTPESVYLGLKMPDKEKDRITEMCGKRNINVYEMTEDTLGYNLIPNKIL